MSTLHGHASTSLPLVTFSSTSPSPPLCGPSDNTIRRFTVVFHFLRSLRLRPGLDKHFKNSILKPLSLSLLGFCEPQKNFKAIPGLTWDCLLALSCYFVYVTFKIGSIGRLWYLLTTSVALSLHSRWFYFSLHDLRCGRLAPHWRSLQWQFCPMM